MIMRGLSSFYRPAARPSEKNYKNINEINLSSF